MKLDNNTNIVITGAASGIGFSLSKELVKQNVNLAILDKDNRKLNNIKSALPQAISLQCDLTDSLELEYCLDKVYEKMKYINILVNCAGLMTSFPLVNILDPNSRKKSFEIWNKTIETNLSSVFFTSSFIAERMVRERTKGLIINISSVSAYGNVGQSAYSAAKSGVETLTKIWSQELAPQGIRCVAISPGFCDTESLNKTLDPQKIEIWKKKTPLKRLASVDEIISGIRFAIDNDFFNGKVLHIDGGLVI
tara:strand:+ start:181 stop:933 length:753 start_codon:yes stop_codon:yes gene_type:complete